MGGRPGQGDPRVCIEATSLGRVNLAMQQNSVPLVQRVALDVADGEALQDVVLAIRTEPQVARPFELRIQHLAPGERREMGPLDIRLDSAVLIRQVERESGSLHVRVTAGGQVVGTAEYPIEVLAYDEWSGDATLHEILAAYVLPNHPDVERILATARDVLGETTGDAALDGYQQKSPRRALAVVRAVHEAIGRLDLSYVNPPASFESDGQKVRTPDRILANRMATCLDLTLLFAACLEQAGLHPLVLLKEGHAWVGAWLVKDTFSTPSVAEPTAIRKRVDLHRICVIETTGVTARPRQTFAAALDVGRAHLDDSDAFLWAVDVAAARRARIRPIPLRAAAGSRAVVVEVEAVQDDPLDRAPGTTTPNDVNPGEDDRDDGEATDEAYDRDFDDADDEDDSRDAPGTATDSETPRSRLDRWKRRLLDLSLRNRLLNFRETKKTLPLLCPDVARLEDALAEGRTFTILPRPRVMSGDDPRDAEVHRGRRGEDARREYLLEELGDRRLHADVEQDELDRRLIEIYRAARTSLEESGANTLYLAVGFLRWYEAPQSSKERRAPLLLLPVEVVRTSVRSGFRVRLCELRGARDQHNHGDRSHQPGRDQLTHAPTRAAPPNHPRRSSSSRRL